ADRDWFAASLGGSCGILDCSLDESSGTSLAERSSRKVGWQLKIEVVDAFTVGFAASRGYLEDGDIHTRGLDGNVSVVHGFTKEVVGTHRACDVVPGAVVAFWLVVFLSEFNSNFELRKNVAFNVKGYLCGIGGRRCITHEGTEMICPKVDLVGKSELAGSNTKLVGYG